jgi:rhodanese-related sulfurtransferase
MLLMAWVIVARAQSSTQPGVPLANTPYCGILSLYGALHLYGRDVTFADLLQSQYVSSPKGSTLDDLQRAARDFGFDAVVLQNMTPGDLRQISSPVIIYVRNEDGDPDYNHYILYIETVGDSAKVLDGARKIRLMSTAELARVWSGMGVVVSPNAIDSSPLFRAGLMRMAVVALLCSAVAAFLILIGRAPCVGRMLATRGRLGIPGAGVQTGVIFGIAGAGALLYHSLHPAGLLASPNAAAAMDQTFAPFLLKTIDVDQARRGRDSGAVLVDARLASDFVRGHIPGSINVPVGTERADRQTILAAVPKSAHIIVFCKSTLCGFSLEVANQLLQDNYTDVVIFRGGWDEWVATYGNPAPSNVEPAVQGG